MSPVLYQPFRYLHSFIYFHSSFKTVTHIGFYQNGHVITCGTHHFLHHHIHKAHTILQRAAELVFTMIGVR
jgi:hypothetical protein